VSASEQQASFEMQMFSIPESIEAMLKEAAEKTGKSQEDILQLCMEHGVKKILEERESGGSNL
jgi:hypothetical protein